MQRSRPRIGVVILNWKRPQEILDCLNSLRRQHYREYEVVVIDNASGNGSVTQIKRRFPEVHVVENGLNLGFAGGSNVGIKYWLERGFDYVFLLNDDTEVAPEMLSTLVASAEADELIGIVGPTIFYFDNPDHMWSAGGSIDRYGAPSHLLADESAPSIGEPRAVDYVTGCGMLIKRSVLERVGLLDERFFAYFEETELCSRARRVGFRILHVPQAHMWHKIGQQERGQSRPYLYLMTRNRLLYVKCSGAPLSTQIRASLQILRTILSWSIRPRHRDMRPFASALARGMLHFYAGRFGAPPVRV